MCIWMGLPVWIVRWENGRGRCVLALQCARGLRLPSGAGRVFMAKTTSSWCRECCAVLSVHSSPCCRGRIALNDFDFLVLNPALQTGIVLQNPSFLGSRTAMDVEGGISPSPARVCGLCTCTYVWRNQMRGPCQFWHPVPAWGHTERHVPLGCYTNTLVQAAGALCESSDDLGLPGGLGELGSKSSKHRPSEGSHLPHCLVC